MHFFPPKQVTNSIRLWVAVSSSESQQPDDPTILDDQARTLLTEQDYARWRRFRPPHKRFQFLASRQALQHVLHMAFPDNQDMKLVTSPSGRPLLLQPDGHTVASLSLSHSGSIVTIVTAPPNVLVGVDCEVIRPISARALFASMGYAASDLVSSDNSSFFDPTDKHSQELAFSLWTAHEAIWKAMPDADQQSLSMPFLSARSIQNGMSSNIEINAIHLQLSRFSTQAALFGSEVLSPQFAAPQLPAANICIAYEKSQRLQH